MGCSSQLPQTLCLPTVTFAATKHGGMHHGSSGSWIFASEQLKISAKAEKAFPCTSHEATGVSRVWAMGAFRVWGSIKITVARVFMYEHHLPSGLDLDGRLPDHPTTEGCLHKDDAVDCAFQPLYSRCVWNVYT